MNWLCDRSRDVAQRRTAGAIAVLFIAIAAVDASAEPEMTFKFSGVRSAAAATFQNEMQRARARVRDFEAIVDAWLATLSR